MDLHKSIPEVQQLMEVALGREPADLAVIHADLVNVYTGEVIKNQSVCTKGKWIAYVGENPEKRLSDPTHIIDARGRPLVPGFIDGHAHLAWLYTPAEFLKYAIPGGTTTIITETMEVFSNAGYEGAIDFLNACQDQPIKIFATAPPMVSISRETCGIPLEDLDRLLEREDILGLGESYWQAVLQEPGRFLPIFQKVLRYGKTLEGHSAGASAGKLMAYTACGISSCHEPITADEVLQRLRLGFTVMIREGSIRRDLEAVSVIKDSDVNFRRLTLVSDGLDPEDLLEKGYMEYVVQKAIDRGFDPVCAIQMASLNTAEHFGIDHLVGGIAPGRFADMLILPDLKTAYPCHVISNGKPVAQEGRLLAFPRSHAFTEKSRKSVLIPEKLEASDFSILSIPGKTRVTVRVIERVTDLVTREIKETFTAVGGEIQADINQDIVKIAAINRRRPSSKMFTGFIKGFNLKAGAIASTGAWDSEDIIVIGADEDDMAVAVNRILTLQGGAVICRGGKVLAEIALPIMGILSELSMKELAEKTRDLNREVSRLGVSLKNPFLTLLTLTGSAIPYLRICEEGLVNLKDGRLLPLFID